MDLLTLLGQAVFALALRVALIVLLATLVMRGIRLFARRTEARLTLPGVDPARAGRLQTLVKTAASTAQAVVIFIAAMMVLYALGINIAPVLAGVSLAGLAVSLGAQALIRDFIGGFLVLFEDQFHVGDVIQVGLTSGTVEEITLRATRVRDDEGRLWTIPNGEVRIVSNHTRDWARAVVDVNVPSGADIERTIAALQVAMRRVAGDDSIGGDLLGEPEIRNWNSLTDSAIQIRLLAKTAPGKQWQVARVMRRQIQAALLEAGSSGPIERATMGPPAA